MLSLSISNLLTVQHDHVILQKMVNLKLSFVSNKVEIRITIIDIQVKH